MALVAFFLFFYSSAKDFGQLFCFFMTDKKNLTLTNLLLHVNDMQDVAQIQQLWRCQGDDLEHPEADVGDGEGEVVADVLTARLLGVADKTRLLVPPHLDQRHRKLQTYTGHFAPTC